MKTSRMAGPAIPWRLLVPLWCLCLVLAAVPSWVAASHTAVTQPTQPYTATLRGRVVSFGLSGFEPDFDPIDRVVISAVLHDRHAKLPDTTLVLSLYLENFQPDTTPILPDLLHPNDVATNLGGFMQGKAALATGGDVIGYRGSLVAEVFLDNTVHLIVDLERQGAPNTAPALRLKGIVTLHKDLSLTGTVRSSRGLTAPEVAALRERRGGPVSWQSVVRGLSVHLPPMMGTAGSARPSAGSDTRARHGVLSAITPTRRQAVSAQPRGRRVPRATQGGVALSFRSLALIAALLLALLAVLLWLWLRPRPPRRPSTTGATDTARDGGPVESPQ